MPHVREGVTVKQRASSRIEDYFYKLVPKCPKDTSAPVPKCPRSEVSWVRSVCTPFASVIVSKWHIYVWHAKHFMPEGRLAGGTEQGVILLNGGPHFYGVEWLGWVG